MTAERVDIVDGWSVEYDAPTLSILENGRAVFTTDAWDPKAHDPREDALFWASEVASPYSGMSVEDSDSDAEAIRYVREHAPQGFADECSMLAEEAAP